jgi:hypothetical protein
MLVSEEIKLLADEIFNADPNITHQGIIDLEGNLLLDQSAAASEPTEPDPDRIAFYKQLSLRRSTREHLDDAYGKTEYIHIVRENMQQMILYLPKITIYLTLEKSITPDEAKAAALKIRLTSSQSVKDTIN